ncbi:MAG TPA: hypothetical protein VLB45_07325 [Nitrosopumilaceae archaeon]|nr:hypothetical protein [Nitrosopumilaceae archaeon]
MASLSYDDYVNNAVADVSVISALDQPIQSGTTYVTGSENHVLSTQFPSIPTGITVTENHSNLVNAPNRLVFESLWIPLLIIGSYILVHTDYAVLSGVKQ